MILWHNIFRYPKFFLSSIIGLILILLNPIILIIKQTKKGDSNIFFLFIIVSTFIGTITALIYILQQMFLEE